MSSLGIGHSAQEPNPTSQQQSHYTSSLSQASAFAVQQQAEKAAEQAEQGNR